MANLFVYGWQRLSGTISRHVPKMKGCVERAFADVSPNYGMVGDFCARVPMISKSSGKKNS